MIEVAQVIAIFAALLILATFAIGAKWLRGPLLQRLDGRRASNAVPAGIAIKLLIAALLFSALAAALAIIGLFAA